MNGRANGNTADDLFRLSSIRAQSALRIVSSIGSVKTPPSLCFRYINRRGFRVSTRKQGKLQTEISRERFSGTSFGNTFTDERSTPILNTKSCSRSGLIDYVNPQRSFVHDLPIFNSRVLVHEATGLFKIIFQTRLPLFHGSTILKFVEISSGKFLQNHHM